jgi:hypothetical protein
MCRLVVGNPVDHLIKAPTQDSFDVVVHDGTGLFEIDIVGCGLEQRFVDCSESAEKRDGPTPVDRMIVPDEAPCG